MHLFGVISPEISGMKSRSWKMFDISPSNYSNNGSANLDFADKSRFEFNFEITARGA